MTDPNHAEHVETVKAQVVDRAVEKAHDRGAYRLFAIGMSVTVGMIAILGVTWLLTSVNQRAEIGDLQRQAQANAAQASTLAKDGQILASQVRQLGGTPSVQPPAPAQIPGPQGSQGSEGRPGRGITGTQIVGGHLVIAYVDGPPVDVGQVAGPPGEKGPEGRSIVGETLSGGHLILAFSDHTTADVGTVVGKDGAPGSKGEPGRGVASSTIDSRWHLIVTYDDRTTQDVGPLPPGPQGPVGPTGPAGPSGPQGAPGPACPPGYEQKQAVVTNPDGSTSPGMSCVKSGAPKTTTATTIPLLPGR